MIKGWRFAILLSCEFLFAGIEVVVCAFQAEKLFLGASFDDDTMVEHDDLVCIPDGGKPVGDHENRFFLHQPVQTLLDQLFGMSVDVACRLIEDHDRRLVQRGSRDAKELSLSFAEVCSVVIEHGIVAKRRSSDEAVGMGILARLDDFL